MNKYISMFLLAFSPLVFADKGFDEAMQQHAQSTARDFVSSMVEQRAKGYSWKVILGTQTPDLLSDTCGYRERVSLPDRNFEAMKKQVSPVVGDRLIKAYQDVLGKPNAHLALVTVKSAQQTSGSYAIVVLKTMPGTPKDPFFSLIYQLDTNGEMDLCDISTTDQINDGILVSLGQELGR
jgi:hypothetical protein